MSANASSMPSAAPATPSDRIPGVSMRSAPPGSRTSSRWVVVWRPRESSSRTAPVRSRSVPSSALTSVDLPTPDEPEHDRGPARREVVGRERRDAVAGERRHRSGPRRPGATASAATPLALEVVGHVGLVEQR